jgi:hypothetical protein
MLLRMKLWNIHTGAIDDRLGKLPIIVQDVSIKHTYLAKLGSLIMYFSPERCMFKNSIFYETSILKMYLSAFNRSKHSG